MRPLCLQQCLNILATGIVLQAQHLRPHAAQEQVGVLFESGTFQLPVLALS